MSESPTPVAPDHPLTQLGGQRQQQHRQDHSTRDRAKKMQLPGSEVGCAVRKIKLEGVCMLS